MNRFICGRETKGLALGASFLLILGCQGEKSSVPAAVEAKAAAAIPEKPEPKPSDQEPPAWAGRLTADSGFPCDVELVLSQSCRRCHWQPRENDAPFSMVSFDDTQKMRSGKPIYKLMEQMVEADLMPPLDALVEPAVTPLTSQQKKTLLDWLKQGAPRSSEKCAL